VRYLFKCKTRHIN